MTTNTTSSYIHTVSDNSSEVSVGNAQEFNLIRFLISNIICLLFALTVIIGNGLVLYTTTKSKCVNHGLLRHMHDVIKSLAIADMLYGLLGVPLNLINYYYHCK